MMPMTACWPRLVSGVMMSTSTSTLFFTAIAWSSRTRSTGPCAVNTMVVMPSTTSGTLVDSSTGLRHSLRKSVTVRPPHRRQIDAKSAKCLWAVAASRKATISCPT